MIIMFDDPNGKRFIDVPMYEVNPFPEWEQRPEGEGIIFRPKNLKPFVVILRYDIHGNPYTFYEIRSAVRKQRQRVFTHFFTFTLAFLSRN